MSPQSPVAHGSPCTPEVSRCDAASETRSNVNFFATNGFFSRARRTFIWAASASTQNPLTVAVAMYSQRSASSSPLQPKTPSRSWSSARLIQPDVDSAMSGRTIFARAFACSPSVMRKSLYFGLLLLFSLCMLVLYRWLSDAEYILGLALPPAWCYAFSRTQPRRHSILVASATAEQAGGGGGAGSSDDFDTRWRDFLVDLPAGYAKGTNRSYPLLVDFHGYYGDSWSERSWSRWVDYQRESGAQFILLTPSGSDDATVRNKLVRWLTRPRGWNVLGWATPSTPLPPLSNASQRRTACAESPAATCASWHVPYACSEHVRSRFADACVPYEWPALPYWLPQWLRAAFSWGDVSASCATMSAVDDTAFIEAALNLASKTYSVDTSRIYLFGQSMGGLACLHMAAHLPSYLRPAAIIPVSAAAACSRGVELHGEVPTLLMHGYRDRVVPPTVWAGGDLDGTGLVRDRVAAPLHASRGADISAAAAAAAAVLPGCQNKYGEACVVSGGGYLYDPLTSTVRAVTGKHVREIASLPFAPVKKVPARLAAAMQCATLPSEAGSGSERGSVNGGSGAVVSGRGGFKGGAWQAHGNRNGDDGFEVDVNERESMNGVKDKGLSFTNGKGPRHRLCLFDGEHCLPWMKGSSCDAWLPESQEGRALHSFIWNDFLQGGELRRES